MTDETYTGIREVLKTTIKGTPWEGHVFFVGGCVRDEMMHLERHDIDIAVDIVNGGIRFARWLEKNHLSARGKSVQTFPHFGTAKVKLRQYPDEVIDCVQTRKDKYVYERHPKPERNFGTVAEDALRRDLTINSLFINISTGELLDPTGYGIHDIENYVVRCPNDADITLTDNPMHVLRCIRFAVKYGWNIDAELMTHLKKNAMILNEARDRQLAKEVMTILSLENKERALQMIDEIGATDIVKRAMEYIQLMKDAGISIDEPWFQRRHRESKRHSNSEENGNTPKHRYYRKSRRKRHNKSKTNEKQTAKKGSSSPQET